MTRKIFLDTVPLDTALKRWKLYLKERDIFEPFHGEAVKVIDSLHRITSEPVAARQSSPFFHSSAMDGYAVRFQDTFGANESSTVRLRRGDQAVSVNTGDPIPDGYDAVIMIEDTNIIRDDTSEYIEIIRAATPYQHVRITGEDIIATELILPGNHRIRAIDIGALLAGGFTEIMARQKPEVAIIPTGNEIVEPGTTLTRGSIIESNSRILENLVNDLGGRGKRYPIVPDDPEKIREAVISAARDNDLVIINAGSSAGTKDFVPEVVRDAGEVILHGLNIKPGRPLLLGWVQETPVMGIPGYPVSAYITFNLFAKPLLLMWLGVREEKREITATLSRQLSSSLGQEEFVRLKIGRVGERYIATPMSRGAGVLMSLVRGDGILRIPALSEGIGSGSEVKVELIRNENEIAHTVVCIGSHDNTLDLLYNILKRRYPEYSLSSAHVGSMGGVMAIRKNEAHMAGTHLLDEASGEYNIPFIERLLSGEKAILMNLVYRQQGFIVRKGNPRNIESFDDLTRDDVAFINRQSGSGTRLLTDKCLREHGISQESINGYEMIEFTHMGVASAVASGIADTGMGILSAAIALGLDFIPVARERYDLLMRKETLELPMIRALMDIIQNDEDFKKTVLTMGGYDIQDMGKVVYSSPE